MSIFDEMLWAFGELPDRYVVIDTETTGFFKDDTAPDPISIGVCVVESNEVVRREEYFVKPGVKYSDNSEMVHGTPWLVASQYPSIESQWDAVRNVLNCELVVAHNALFDWRVLVQAQKQGGLATLNVAGVFCSQRAAHSWALANRLPCSERGPSLDGLLAEVGEKRRNTIHTALNDAECVFSVIHELQNRLKSVN